MVSRAPAMKLVAALCPSSAKKANTSSRTKRTSDSPDRPLAQIDQRKRSRGMVDAVLSTLAPPPPVS